MLNFFKLEQQIAEQMREARIPGLALAIMRLVETGKLDLDHPIVHYVPWITFRQPGAERRITLRMLLSHTSGLRTRHERSEPRLPREPAGLEAFIRDKVPRLACIAKPGTVFAYSNAGLSLAGYIAETIAGQYFPNVIQEHVLDPLDMRRTTYDRPVAMTYPLALPHAVGADGVLRVTHFYQTNTPGNPSGFAIAPINCANDDAPRRDPVRTSSGTGG